MAEPNSLGSLILEPYSAVQHWTLPAGASPQGLSPEGASPEGASPQGPSPQAVLKDYLEALARNLQAAGECVIGHIKALALFPDQGYLRVSVVAAHLPATIDGSAPPGCASLEVTLNVLVYGLARGRIEQITGQTAQQMAEKWQLEIS